MYYLPTSCLFFFFLFSLFHNLSSASTKKELGWCEARFECGNITAGFPFSGGSRPQFCGHPSLELHCFNNKTSMIISNHLYDVLHIDEKLKTLRLVRAELDGSFCTATFTATTLPSEIFELLPSSHSLTVFYLCDRKLRYSSSYTCPDRGPVLVSQNIDYNKSCQDSFTINVPKSYVPEEKELNLQHLENALNEGFDVKVKIDEKACEECMSSHGICGFKNKQICCKNDSSSKCNPVHLPDATELHRRCSTPFRCGNQTGLLYPFWTSEREDCGHPDFKLDCSDFAELSISSVKFRIVETNYVSRFIRLARSDYIGNLCPKDPLHVPFDESVLPLEPNTDLLTIYYDCSQDFSPFVSTYVGDISCGGDNDDGRSYYVTRNLSSSLLDGIRTQLNNFRVSCKSVSIPASGYWLNTLQINHTADNLQKALAEGFKLEFNQECVTCMNNAGACGYNRSSSSFTCYYMDEPLNGTTKKGLSTGVIRGIEYTLGSVAIILIVSSLFCLIRQRRKTSDVPRKLDLKALFPLKHYSYAQVKKITKSFAEVVGKGGFGTVYKGTLSDGRKVAVKVLNNSKGYNGEDFINEVASIGQTSHVNIVTLLGFCSEGSKRAIIYEFLENGSLDKFISSKRSLNMDLMELYGIALGVARGLEYLHHGCRTRIVHFDIKPQNVLLDDNLCPKVSDFGLAKLGERKESIMSLLDTRGTIGYIAPEVFSRVYGRVSHKSDVYSYGMLVLEMIGARAKTATEDTASSSSSMYFPEWIYKDLEKGVSGLPNENGITFEEEEIAKKMRLVGLWSVQYSPSDRPPMNRVVEMMEGSLGALEVPPRPVLQIPTAPLPESSTVSEDISVYTEALLNKE